MITNEFITVENYSNYCIVKISRKPNNAIDLKTAVDLAYIIENLSNDKAIRAIIITGGIPFSFITGSDLDEFYEIMNQKGNVRENAVKASKPVQDALTRIEKSPKVIIAAINGITIGLGVELALVCDFRIASELAWYKFAQINIGIIPGAGGTQRLPKIVGVAKAKEFILTGKKINSDEALQCGLVNKLVKHGDELNYAINLAEEIAKNTPSNAIYLAKQSLDISKAMNLSFQEKLDWEMDLFGRTYDSQNAFEGIKAALEKRKPSFIKE